MSTPNETPSEAVERWTPYIVFTWTTKTLRLWYERWGAWAMYDGKMWCPKVRKLHAGMNEVRFVEYDHAK